MNLDDGIPSRSDEMFKWLKRKLKQIFRKNPVIREEAKFQGFKYKEDSGDLFQDDYYDYH